MFANEMYCISMGLPKKTRKAGPKWFFYGFGQLPATPRICHMAKRFNSDTTHDRQSRHHVCRFRHHVCRFFPTCGLTSVLNHCGWLITHGLATDEKGCGEGGMSCGRDFFFFPAAKKTQIWQHGNEFGEAESVLSGGGEESTTTRTGER